MNQHSSFPLINRFGLSEEPGPALNFTDDLSASISASVREEIGG
jgi:hypothetical protein